MLPESVPSVFELGEESSDTVREDPLVDGKLPRDRFSLARPEDTVASFIQQHSPESHPQQMRMELWQGYWTTYFEVQSPPEKLSLIRIRMRISDADCNASHGYASFEALRPQLTFVVHQSN